MIKLWIQPWMSYLQQIYDAMNLPDMEKIISFACQSVSLATKNSRNT